MLAIAGIDEWSFQECNQIGLNPSLCAFSTRVIWSARIAAGVALSIHTGHGFEQVLKFGTSFPVSAITAEIDLHQDKLLCNAHNRQHRARALAVSPM